MSDRPARSKETLLNPRGRLADSLPAYREYLAARIGVPNCPTAQDAQSFLFSAREKGKILIYPTVIAREIDDYDHLITDSSDLRNDLVPNIYPISTSSPFFYCMRSVMMLLIGAGFAKEICVW